MREIIQLLHAVESAPSAVHLVAHIANIELDYEPYESSEGFNDCKTEEIIGNMNHSQFTELVNTLKSLLEEMRDFDPEAYQDIFEDEDPLSSDLFK